MDNISCISAILGAAAAFFGIGYKLCPKTPHKPIISTIKRECSIYSEHNPGRNASRRFEVTLADGKPTTCTCPKLIGTKCAITQDSCVLL